VPAKITLDAYAASHRAVADLKELTNRQKLDMQLKALAIMGKAVD